MIDFALVYTVDGPSTFAIVQRIKLRLVKKMYLLIYYKTYGMSHLYKIEVLRRKKKNKNNNITKQKKTRLWK